jgi:uncharacterized membrane protein (DUF106 family)|tara:strand:- start:317 stop:580 length:264 start_codon:yes stop_codon:yes gene_type:complete
MDITAAAFLSMLNNRLVEVILKPLLSLARPRLSKDLLLYMSIITGIGMAFYSNTNLLEQYFDPPIVGVIVTGIIIGGGSNLIHDLFG